MLDLSSVKAEPCTACFACPVLFHEVQSVWEIVTHGMTCACRAQKQIAELEAEIEALEEELEKATAANKEATHTKAAVDELSAEVATLKERVRDPPLPHCAHHS